MMFTVSASRTLFAFLVLFLVFVSDRSEAQTNNSWVNSNVTSQSSSTQGEDIEKWLSAPQITRERKNSIAALLGVFGVVAVFSNALIIHAVRTNQHMHTTTNYFIANMACADLLLSSSNVAFGIKFLNTGLKWNTDILGQITCSCVLLYTNVAILCSIFSLVAIAFDRFMAVTRPLMYKYCSSWAKYILPAIWVASLAMPLPLVIQNAVVKKIYSNTSYCMFEINENLHQNHIIVWSGYILPHVVMVILYSIIAYKLWTRRVPGEQRVDRRHIENNAHQRAAKRVTYMAVCVLGAFELIWAPVTIVQVLMYFPSTLLNGIRSELIAILNGPPILNGPINLLIYAAFSENYRSAFKAVLRIERWNLCRIIPKHRTHDMNIVQLAASGSAPSAVQPAVDNTVLYDTNIAQLAASGSAPPAVQPAVYNTVLYDMNIAQLAASGSAPPAVQPAVDNTVLNLSNQNSLA